jgi:group I intron endonuclease
MQSSIYKITHVASGRFYIGSAVNTKARWIRHEQQLKRNQHHSKYLQRLYNKYGHESIKFEVIEYCYKEKLLEREQHYLDTLNPALNSHKIAGSPLGHKWSDEAKKRHSEMLKGRKVTFSDQGKANIIKAAKRPRTDQTKKKMSEAAKNRDMAHLRTPEAISKVAEKHRGMKRSEETRKRISESKKGTKMPEHAIVVMRQRMRSLEMRALLSEKAKGKIPHNKGKKMSDEQKRKLSEAKKGKKLSEEHKTKIKQSCAKGFDHTNEAKKKIAESKRKFTDEQVLEIRRLHTSGLSHQKLADMYKVQRHTIGRVINGLGIYRSE